MATVEECVNVDDAVAADEASDVIDVEFHEEPDERDLLIRDIDKAQKWRRKTLLDWETAKFRAKEAKEIHEGACQSLDELISELTGSNIRPLFTKPKPTTVIPTEPEPDDDDDLADDLDEDDDADDGRDLASLGGARTPLAIEGPKDERGEDSRGDVLHDALFPNDEAKRVWAAFRDAGVVSDHDVSTALGAIWPKESSFEDADEPRYRVRGGASPEFWIDGVCLKGPDLAAAVRLVLRIPAPSGAPALPGTPETPPEKPKRGRGKKGPTA